MTWLDLLILALVAGSAVIGLFRGLAREVVSLASWVLAFWLAIRFAAPLAGLLEGLIASAMVRLAVTFVAIFVAVLTLGALVNFLAAAAVGRSGLSRHDRALGVAFGALRGLVVAALLLVIGSFTALPEERGWQGSRLAHLLEGGVCRVGGERWLERLDGLHVPLAEAADPVEDARQYWARRCAGLD